MDFGIAATLRVALLTYRALSRRSGRTSSTVERLKAGDLFAVATVQEADRARRLIRERDPELAGQVTVAAFSHLSALRDYLAGRRLKGRVILDHDLIELLFEHSIERTSRDLAELASIRPIPADDDAARAISIMRDRDWLL
jgi:hypothetical protein